MCFRSNNAALPNRELDKYQSWRRWAYAVTALVIAFCVAAVQIHHLNNHWHERYNKYLEDGRKNQSIGADLVSGSCRNKPLDHKTELIDCVRAREMNNIDPERLAYNLAFEHLYTTPSAAINTETAAVTVAMLVFGCMVVAAIFIYIRCFLGFKEKRRVEKMAHGNPVQQSTKVLFDRLGDTAKVKRFLQTGDFVEAGTQVAAIQQAYNDLAATRKAVANNEVALIPTVGPEHQQGEDQFLHLRTPFTLFEADGLYKQKQGV